MRRVLILVAAVFLALLALPSTALAGGFCMGHMKGEAYTDVAATKVRMSNNCFSPTVVRVNPGDTVTFVNADPEVHGVGGAAGTFGDAHKEIKSGSSVSFRFDEEGVFPYACVFHPGMTAAVVVGDGEGDAAAAGMVAVEQEPPAKSRPASQPTGADLETSNVPLAVGLGIALVLLVASITALIRRSRPREVAPTH